ncbi:hypothetical protein KPH14_000943, partial [Odynerus spinipes]
MFESADGAETAELGAVFGPDRSWDDPEDAWYNRRRKDIEDHPERLPNWRVEDGRMYYHREDDDIAPLVDDLDAWKLVVPRNAREAILN